MNNVTLIGNLVRDVDLRYTPSNVSVGKFTLALNRMKKEGQEQSADFINIVTFGKTAENCANYLSKGKKVGVEGRLQSGKYENKEGHAVYTVDVIASNVEFLSWGNEDKKEPNQGLNDIPSGFQPTDSSDIPF